MLSTSLPLVARVARRDGGGMALAGVGFAPTAQAVRGRDLRLAPHPPLWGTLPTGGGR